MSVMVAVPKFRRKQAGIEAMRFDGTWQSAQDILAWMEGSSIAVWRGNHTLVIATLEREHIAEAGDWVVREGECDYLPYDPVAFAAHYEPLG